jgi:hypothetical protein
MVLAVGVDISTRNVPISVRPDVEASGFIAEPLGGRHHIRLLCSLVAYPPGAVSKPDAPIIDQVISS